MRVLSIIRPSDYSNDRKRVNREPHPSKKRGTRLPTSYKTVYTTCPFCGKKAFNREMGGCRNCHKKFEPDKQAHFVKFKITKPDKK